MKKIEIEVMKAAREYTINSFLFRNAMSRKSGLNLTESLCLTLLGMKKASTPTEVARYTGLKSGSVTSMLDRLENKKIIIRKNNPDDRRGVIIEVNDDYSRKAAELASGVQKSHSRVMKKYSESELEVIRDFLLELSSNLEEESEKLDS